MTWRIDENGVIRADESSITLSIIPVAGERYQLDRVFQDGSTVKLAIYPSLDMAMRDGEFYREHNKTDEERQKDRDLLAEVRGFWKPLVDG